MEKALKINIFLIIVFCGAVFNYFLPVFRFESRLLDLLFYIFAFLIPLFVFVISFWIKNNWLKAIFALGSLCAGLFSVLMAALFAFTFISAITDGHDSSYEMIARVDMAGSYVTAYRTNGGATTACGITIMQEKRFLPGIFIVKCLYDKYRMDLVEFKGLGKYVVDASIYGYTEERTHFHLKEFVYF